MKKYENQAIALSLATLLMLPLWEDEVYHPAVAYFSRTMPWVGLATLFVVLVLLALACFVLVRSLKKKPEGFFGWVSYLAILSGLAIVLDRARVESGISVEYRFFSISGFLGNWGRVGTQLKIVFLGGLILWLIVRFRSHVVRLLRGGLLALSPVPCLLLGSVFVISFRPLTKDSFNHLSNEKVSVKRRLVWFVFDAMDEHYSFEGRPKNISLPHFDRLKQEAFWAQRAYPPSNATLLSLPAYLTGKRVERARAVGRNHLRLKMCDDSKRINFRDLPTVFSELGDKGLKRGAMGWVHPYCRLFAENIDVCGWEHDAGRPYESSLVGDLEVAWNEILHPRSLADRHSSTYYRMEPKIVDMAANPELNFVFLHIPTPHLPGIKRIEKIGVGPGNEIDDYFSNLELADELFGKARTQMEQNGTWDQSIVIVTADHWWRNPHKAGLMDEDPEVYFKIPFLVKLAGAHESVPYAPRFNTIVLHDLVIELMKGKLNTISEVSGWLDKHRSDQAPLFDDRLANVGLRPWGCHTQLTGDRFYRKDERYSLSD